MSFSLRHYLSVPLSEVLLSRRPSERSIFEMSAERKPVKINVDLGEGYGNFRCGPDDELIPLIDHANVACGFHAGDPLISRRTIGERAAANRR